LGRRLGRTPTVAPLPRCARGMSDNGLYYMRLGGLAAVCALVVLKSRQDNKVVTTGTWRRPRARWRAGAVCPPHMPREPPLAEPGALGVAAPGEPRSRPTAVRSDALSCALHVVLCNSRSRALSPLR